MSSTRYLKKVSKTKLNQVALTELVAKHYGRGCTARVAKELGVGYLTVRNACLFYGIAIPVGSKIPSDHRFQFLNDREIELTGCSLQTNARKRNILVHLVRDAKVRAVKRGLEFDLHPSDLSLPELCPVLGIPIKINAGKVKGFYGNSPSIDRVDNSRGYTWDNCIVVSLRANKLKNDATLQELSAVVEFYSSLTGPQSRKPIVFGRQRTDRKLTIETEQALKNEYDSGGCTVIKILAEKYCISTDTVSHIVRNIRICTNRVDGKLVTTKVCRGLINFYAP